MLTQLFWKLVTALQSLRAGILAVVEKIPFWPEIVRLAAMIVAPFCLLAKRVLRVFPFLRRLEWLLEIETLTRRHPVILALAVLYVVWRGLHLTHLGHIGTDPMIYPMLAAISGFNPFLGLICGALFGIGDLIQKLFWSDIYGAMTRGDEDYWPAVGGYIIAYSSTMCMGLLPGLLARVFRLFVRLVMRRILFRQAAATADGANPPDRYAFLKYYNPNTQTFNLDFKDPRVLEVVHGLATDPRNLLADPDSWRKQKLSPEQKLVMAQLRGRRLLGPEGHPRLQELVGRAARGQQAAATGGEDWRLLGEPQPRAPGDREPYPLADALALLIGGGLGGYLTMDLIAPRTEIPAFLWRPNPDYDCLNEELGTWLYGRAHIGAAGGALGALTPIAVPPSPGPAGGEGAGPAPSGPPPEDVERATNLQNELNERRAWLDKLRRDHQGFRTTHQWESDYQERLRALEQDIRDEERNISDLERRLDSLRVKADPAEVRRFGYTTRYHAGDAANREHAFDVAEDELRRAAGTRYKNLLRILDRVERDDKGDLRRLLEEGSRLSTQVSQLMTEFSTGAWVTPEDTFGRESFLRRLRSRLKDLGRVDEKGRFYGSLHGPGPEEDPNSFAGRINDISPSLRAVGRLVKTQMGEVPVTYGAEDAWADRLATVSNALSLGTGAEVDEALERGGGPLDVGYAFGHALLNTVTRGGLAGAEKGWRDYWSRGVHDFAAPNYAMGLVYTATDYFLALAYSAGSGIAHVADNTVIPLSSVRTILDSDATPRERLGAAAHILLTQNMLRVRMGGEPLRAIVKDYLKRRPSAPIQPPLPRIGPEDPLSHMPATPVERGTYVRNLLRDQGIRESLVKRVGYKPGPRPKFTAEGWRVRLGRALAGEVPKAQVYDAAFRRGRASVLDTALHEVQHLQQLDQARVLAARGGPLQHYFRGPTGDPTAAGNRRMEMQVRLEELDRNLRIRDDTLRRAGIDTRTPMKKWPQRARIAAREVQDARQALDSLIERDRRVRSVAARLEGENLSVDQQHQRIQTLSSDIDGIKRRLDTDYGPKHAHEPGARKLRSELEARSIELEARQARVRRLTGCDFNDQTGAIEKFSRATKKVIFQKNLEKYPEHDGYTCECCNFVNRDKRYFHADHIDPESLPNSTDDPTNGRVLCVACNTSRGNRAAPKLGVGLAYRYPSANKAPPELRPRWTVKVMTEAEFKAFTTRRKIYDQPDI